MAKLDELAERVDRLVLRHQELKRTSALMAQQLVAVTNERDSLRSRLAAARERIDTLISRLPDSAEAARADGGREHATVKQVEVNILGQVYMLGCPEGGEPALASAVAAVDREMAAIREAGRVRTRERIAVLAALNLAYRMAEQERAPAPPPPPSPPAPPAPQTEPTASASDDAALETLMRRVDKALADDGQLL